MIAPMAFLDTAFTWQGVLAQLVVAYISLLFWYRYLSPISNVPGPFFASFSRLWHVRRIFAGDQSEAQLSLHRKHGHFVRISHEEVSISHPDAVKKILLTPLRKAPWYSILNLPDWRYQTPMGTLDPKAKMERSRWLSSGYLTSNLLQSEEQMDQHMGFLLDWMDRYATTGEAMHLDKFFTYCAFDVVGEVMFSRPFGFIEQGVDIGQAIEHSLGLNKLVAAGGFYRTLFFTFTNPIATKLNLLPMSYLGDVSQSALQSRLDDTEARFDIVEHWLKNHRTHPDKLSFRDIQGVTATNIGAGSDTVSTAIQSVVYHMIRHPATWQKARAEIRQHLSQGQGQEGGRIVSFADAQNLPYLQACIKEAIRVFPPVGMGLSRQSPAGGITIGSRHFPEGTLLSVNPYVIHHSREIWGDDADSFRPERWLEEDIAGREKFFIPWGLGYMSCPGQMLSKIEIAKMAATIIRDYDVSLVDDQQQWQSKAYFTTVPQDWPVHITKATASS